MAEPDKIDPGHPTIPEPVGSPDPERREIRLEIEVPGSVEEVWEAIATGPGISSWYVPHTVEERSGGAATASFGLTAITADRQAGMPSTTETPVNVSASHARRAASISTTATRSAATTSAARTNWRGFTPRPIRPSRPASKPAPPDQLAVVRISSMISTASSLVARARLPWRGASSAASTGASRP